ncbi:MAG: hypothetical protein ACI4GX_04290 [Ruminococcus sp.]|uniref:hypothetical protein n=1 Tax=Ruminococcus sp. TaxID=41978 RepID=UPI003EF10F7F
MAEFKGKSKHQTTGKKGQTDFYVIIDYKKMRGVKLCEMEDGDGDKDSCIVIPLCKNGIRAFTKSRWRVILAARKSHRDENASHILIPQVEDDIQKAMVAKGYFSRYRYSAPIVGDVVPDITKIPCAPTFSENSSSYTDMQENATDNPNGGSVNVTQDNQGKVNDGLDNGVLSSAQRNIRERILALKKKKEE